MSLETTTRYIYKILPSAKDDERFALPTTVPEALYPFIENYQFFVSDLDAGVRSLLSSSLHTFLYLILLPISNFQPPRAFAPFPLKSKKKLK
jgi:hypothetical protein